MANRTASVEKWTWILIYGGLLLLVVGLAVRGLDAVLSWLLICGGGLAAALGVLLIAIRARMKDEGKPDATRRG